MGLFDSVDWGGVIGTGLQIGGAIAGGVASYNAASAAEDQADAQAAELQRVAKENAKISRYDATVAEEQARAEYDTTVAEFKKHYFDVNKLLAEQKTRFAKGGVAGGTGTPLSVRGNTAKRAYEDGQILLHNGENAVQRQKSLAKRYRMLADAGLRDSAAQASMIRDAGTDAATSYYVSGATNLLNDMYKIGDSFGWF
jgi:hypothetical protein